MSKKVQFQFVNAPGTYQLDLMEYTSSNYVTINSNKGYIFTMYNPSNKLLFLQFILQKKPELCKQALINFQKYLKDNNIKNKEFKQIVSDKGKEYEGIFKKYLQEQNIKHRIINPELKNHLSLAPINSMMRFVRAQLTKEMITIQKTKEYFLDEIELQKICQKIQNFQNHKIIPKFKKSPFEITIEEIQVLNDQIEEINEDLEQKYQYDIGDIVKIKLQKELFDKGRHQKWSDGKYKVIGRTGIQYIVVPLLFDKKQYKDYFQDKYNFEMIGEPCYFRKPYELKESQIEDDDQYFVAENLFSQYQTFKQIYSCEEDNIKDVKPNTNYTILTINGKKIKIQAMNLRIDSNKMDEVEYQFFFPGIYENIEINQPIVRI